MKTVRKEGVRGLYKGMASPLSTVPLVNAVVFTCYAHGLSWLEKKFPVEPPPPGELKLSRYSDIALVCIF